VFKWLGIMTKLNNVNELKTTEMDKEELTRLLIKVYKQSAIDGGADDYDYDSIIEHGMPFIEAQVNVALGNVSKCSFDCDNPVYEEGASYCKEHMECDDWT